MQILDIYHQFGIPFLLAVTLSLLKLLAAGQVPSLDDANDTALDLIFIAVGALSVMNKADWTGEKYLSAFAGDLLLALLLLTARAERLRKNAKLLKTGAKAPPVSTLTGILELMIGAYSILWTVNAP